MKTALFELFKTDPEQNDVRNLSQRFKISTDRIKAIIKQKTLELELAKDGRIVSDEYITAMEENLGTSECTDEIASPFRIRNTLSLRPLFVTIPEGAKFDFVDAKNALLQRGITIKESNPDSEENELIPSSDLEKCHPRQ